MSEYKNLLVLGASGGVAGAFLQHLESHRGSFDCLTLSDQHPAVLDNPFIPKSLDYKFVGGSFSGPDGLERLAALLKDRRITHAVDLTNIDTLPLMEVMDHLGVHYLNAGYADSKRDLVTALPDIEKAKRSQRGSTKILFSGMNPGVANFWVGSGIKEFGVPDSMVHFESDDSERLDPSQKPIVTWSPHEYLVETVHEQTGIVGEGGVVCPILPNGISNLQDLRPYLEPVLPLERYPLGSQILHEENVTLGGRFQRPSQFIYAINPRAMDHILRIFKETGTVQDGDLEKADNVGIPLRGGELVGVALDYPTQRVCYLNRLKNQEVRGTNATYYQVGVGVLAGTLELLQGKLDSRTYFTEELLGTSFAATVLDRLPTEKYVFDKDQAGQLHLRGYDPRMAVN